MDIGENLRARRVQLKMTQTDLSRKTGIKQPTISAIENGVNKPAIETIMLLSDALGCTVSDLVGQSSPVQPKERRTSRQHQLLQIFDQLNEAGQDFLLQQAENILQQPSFRKEGSTSSAM